LVSYVELKVDPHTPEGRELINNLEHYRLPKKLRLPQMLEILDASSAAEIESMVELARRESFK
jgi:hypothetical protein